MQSLHRSNASRAKVYVIKKWRFNTKTELMEALQIKLLVAFGFQNLNQKDSTLGFQANANLNSKLFFMLKYRIPTQQAIN